MNLAPYAKSTDVHRTLSGIFKPWCSENGFKSLNSKRCAFIKSSELNDGVILAFEVQCNSFGRSMHGGSFTFNANAGVIDPGFLSGPHSRILIFCSKEMPEIALQLEKQFIASSPQLGNPGRPWEYGMDNWCRYYTIEDVQKWGYFLRPYLPFLLKQLLGKLLFSENEFSF